MSSMTLNPAHLSNDDWARVRAFLDSAKKRGEVVDFSTRVELLTPAEVARRLGMSRSTVLRRIADGDIKATKVGTHHRISLNEYERYTRELRLTPPRRKEQRGSKDGSGGDPCNYPLRGR